VTRTGKYPIEGYNGRLDSIQAGILTVKLKLLPEWNEKRRACAAVYNHLLKDIAGITLPLENPRANPSTIFM
jgi:dTDP-4-amino-4,6-dideoxygalactose transaminase